MILLVFAVVGGLLAIVELLGVVLSCCMASQFSQLEREAAGSELHWGGGGGMGPGSEFDDYDTRGSAAAGPEQQVVQPRTELPLSNGN